jgi:hypothetical protein
MTCTQRDTPAPVLGKALAVALAALVMSAAGPPPGAAAERQSQKSFATPQDAVNALLAAAKGGSADELLAIFGPEAPGVLSSGDPVADQKSREVFVVAAEQGWTLVDQAAGAKELVVGHEGWPFPIPLVKDEKGWRFDTAAGAEEILARRIGRNELATIRSCMVYVRAQKEYAGQSHDDKPAGLYAQKFASAPGSQDGLYWSAEPGAKPSPLGEFAARAATEGYFGAGPKTRPTPFRGYFFRILTAQGKDAPGGAKSYVANGDMTGGFALVAYPAEYANSGVMTFIVAQDGVVYEKDLGPETGKLGAELKEYNPDSGWRKVE